MPQIFTISRFEKKQFNWVEVSVGTNQIRLILPPVTEIAFA